MNPYKKLIGWLAKRVAKKRPTNIIRQQQKKGYPYLGSLDANFQDYARKNLLPLKGFGIQMPKKISKPALKTKTVTGKQLRIPGMQSGGSLRKVNGSWVRK